MKARLAAALAAAAVIVSACGDAQTQGREDRFNTVVVDGVRCIVWLPYDGTGNGAQMNCDFR